LLAAVVVAAGAGPSRAQSANEAAAETLFREGRDLLERKQYPEACRKLEGSYRLDPASGTLLGMAMCHEAQGKLATAWLEYKQVIARVGPEGRADRERAAMERVEALDGRLATIAVSVPAEAARDPELKVTYDGQPIGAAAWSAAFPVDPGEHVIEATAPSKRPWQVKVVIGPGPEKRVVEIPLLEAVARPAPPIVRQLAVADRPPGRSRASRVVAFTLGGAGLAAVGAGGFLGFRALQQKNDAQSQGCAGDACTTPGGRATRLDAGRTADAATVAFIAGGALLSAGAIVYWLRGASPSPASASGPALAVDLAAGSVSIRGSF
jgi:hypothetical protein